MKIFHCLKPCHILILLSIQTVNSDGNNHKLNDPADTLTLYNDYTIKMVGCDTGEGVYAGRLELLYQSYWGTICGDTFDEKAAAVACYSLGYSRSRAIYLYNSYGGPADRKVILHQLNCTGTESHLDHCEHPHYNSNGVPCDHSQDVYVACEANKDSYGRDILGYQVRICANPGDDCEYNPTVTRGRLEILYDSKWGTVCDFRFNETIYPPLVPVPIQNQAATIACRNSMRVSSDYNVLGVFVSSGGALQATDARPIWMGWVTCTGVELNLGSCPHAAWGTHTCNHNDDVVIECKLSTKDGRILSDAETAAVLEESKNPKSGKGKKKTQ